MIDHSYTDEVIKTTRTAKNDSPPLPIIPTSNNIEAPENLPEHQLKLWQMRWCFFWTGTVLSVLWMIACIAASIIIFCVTKSFYSFLVSSGTTLTFWFLRRLANYLLPIDEKRFLLKQMKIENAQNNARPENKKGKE